jgi:metal-responsive CopG/Arc/MetJ family transcriptional regulator
MVNEKKQIQLVVKIPKVLSDKLKEYTKKNCINKSAFVRKLIEDNIKI